MKRSESMYQTVLTSYFTSLQYKKDKWKEAKQGIKLFWHLTSLLSITKKKWREAKQGTKLFWYLSSLLSIKKKTNEKKWSKVSNCFDIFLRFSPLKKDKWKEAKQGIKLFWHLTSLLSNTKKKMKRSEARYQTVLISFFTSLH